MRGHVHKRGHSWAVVVDVGRDSETGKRRHSWRSGFHTRRDAERALTEQLGRLERGGYVELSRLTVAAYLTEWLAAIETRGLRPATLSSYRMFVTKHLTPRLGSIPLQQFSATHLNACYADMLASGRRNGKGGLLPRTVRYAHSVIRKALANAVRWNRLVRNVADSADPPRKAATRTAPKTWTAAELRHFLDHVAEDRLAAAWRLAASTGMRRGEVLGLAWTALDLDAGRLAVRQTLGVVDYQPRLAQPKTERSRRQVALDPETVAALREHRRRQLEERLAAGDVWTNPGVSSSPARTARRSTRRPSRRRSSATRPPPSSRGSRCTACAIHTRPSPSRPASIRRWSPTGSATTRPRSRWTRTRRRSPPYRRARLRR